MNNSFDKQQWAEEHNFTPDEEDPHYEEWATYDEDKDEWICDTCEEPIDDCGCDPTEYDDVPREEYNRMVRSGSWERGYR